VTTSPSPLASRARRRRRRPVLRWALWAVGLAVVFGLGVAVGQAIQDRPRAGKPVTNVTTIRPWTDTGQR
jgi:hypothetical protein